MVKSFVVLTALAVLTVFSGCSSVPRAKSNRHGLVDRWSNNGEVVDTAHLGKKFDAKEINDIPSGKQELGQWVWPLETVKINSRFGKRRRGFHEGVDLKAAVGTPVYATQAGEVIYADSKIGGYGNMIVIKHAVGLFSVYGHMSKMDVKPGDKVSQKEQIGLSGKSGRVRGPHLHFEVRRGSVALNPVNFYERGNVFSKPTRMIASRTPKKKKRTKRL